MSDPAGVAADQLWLELSEKIDRTSMEEYPNMCLITKEELANAMSYATRNCYNFVVAWAVERWDAEVKYRPLVNVHRRTLDDTWRQVIRRFGGDPDALVGLSHDALLEAAGKP